MAGGLVLLLAGGVAGVGLCTRVSYGVWSPFSPPDRFQFCGVRYYRSDEDPAVTVSRAQALRTEQSSRWLPATSVGPRGWRVYRTSLWSCPEPDGRNGTGHDLYVKTGQDRYMAMTDQN